MVSSSQAASARLLYALQFADNTPHGEFIKKKQFFSS